MPPNNMLLAAVREGFRDESVSSCPGCDVSSNTTAHRFPILSDNDTAKDANNELDGSLWECRASAKSMRTTNPIRAIVDPIVSHSMSGEDRYDGKEQITLALGDPSVYDNLKPCPVLVEAAVKCATSRIHAGYVNACGSNEARAAIAKSCTTLAVAVSPDDVVIANGCSGALELALTTILDEGSILLVPRPGFPLYQVIAESHGATVLHYNLDPEEGWECDLNHVEELLLQHKKFIRAMIVTNPSNPCGSVYSKAHLSDILRLASNYTLPIVSDEVYGGITFGNAPFHPLGPLSAEMGKLTPVITASGLGKQFLVPGWRVGWLVFYDCEGALKDIEVGVKKLAQVVLGASHLIQGTISAVMDPNTRENAFAVIRWKKDLNSTLERQANFICTELMKCRGLEVFFAAGAMYAMIRIKIDFFDNAICNDRDFARLLLKEENVFILPGAAFGAPNFVRIVFCASRDVLAEAATRILSFCARHAEGDELDKEVHW